MAVLSQMLLEALDAHESPLASEAFRGDLLALKQRSHALLEALAVDRARDTD